MHSPTIKQKEDLYEYLSSFITDERKYKFDSIIQSRTRHLTVVLEDIFQPHNASAVLRTCECFGIQDVHIIENNNEYRINPDVALGATNWLSMHYYNSRKHNTELCIDTLKKSGYTIVATLPHENSCLINELDISVKTALLFGTEKDGLSAKALKKADKHVKIPMYGFTESLNISVSAALCIYSLTEKMKNLSIHNPLSYEEQLDTKIKWVKQNLKGADIIEKKYYDSLLKKK